MITKAEALSLYPSGAKLAQALGYDSRQAVYMWSDKGPIPELAYLKLRYQLKPEAFDASGKLRKVRARRAA